MQRIRSESSLAVLSRLDRVKLDLDAISQQVNEIASLLATRGSRDLSSMAEGLIVLRGNVDGIAATANAVAADHIHSGREDAIALKGVLQARTSSVQQQICDLQSTISAFLLARQHQQHDAVSSPETSPSPAVPYPSQPPLLSHYSSTDAGYSILPLTAEASLVRMADDSQLEEQEAQQPPEEAGGREDIDAGHSQKSSETGLQRTDTTDSSLHRRSSTSEMPSETSLYSWGRTDLGALFLDARGDGGYSRPIRSKYSKKNFANLCTTLYHTVAVTTTGEVYGAGVNDDGQVSPDRTDSSQISNPILVEALMNQRVIQVSCGEKHTACLTASGAVISFGSNEVGQLGHSQTVSTKVGPRTMAGLGGKIIKQVSCGYLFTLILTSEGEIWSCGVGECVGHADGANRSQAERIPLLRFVPAAYLATGCSHSVAVTVTGHVWSWGANTNGQCGVTDAQTVQEPIQITSLSNIRTAACGAHHTLFLDHSGNVYACGKNHRGQLGLPVGSSVTASGSPGSPVVGRPVCVDQLHGMSVSMLACGDVHSLILTKDGKVLGIGANKSGQLGRKENGPKLENSMDLSKEGEWEAREVCGLEAARIFFIAAGGEQSFALSLADTPSKNGEMNGPSGGGPLMMDEGALDLIRKFSVLQPPTSFHTTEDLLIRIEDCSHPLAMNDQPALIEGLQRTLADLFCSATLVNGSFLAQQTASGLDVLGLEAIYIRTLKLSDSAAFLSKLNAAFSVGIDALLTNVKGLTDPDSLRCILAYWQCPINTQTTISKDAFQKLCDIVVRLPAEAREQLFAWTGNDYPQHLFATRLLKPLQNHLAYHLTQNFGKGRAVPTIAVIMSYLFAINEQRPKASSVPLEHFANDAVSNLPEESLLHDLRNWKVRRRENQFTFCSFPFLLSAEAKRRLLNAEAAMEQQQAAQRDMMRTFLQGGSVMPYLVLQVDRTHLLQSTLIQIGQMDGTMLKKQLKIIFVGEEGVDEGGVKKGGEDNSSIDRYAGHAMANLAKVDCRSFPLLTPPEFFQLLIGQLFDFNYGMFKLTDSKRDIWFNSGCTWSSDEYSLVGCLIGLAIYNSTLLDLHFPLVVYAKLLGIESGLCDLGTVEPELMKGLQKLLAYDEAATQTRVEDTFGLVFEVTWTEFDELKRHELKPGGSNIEVTAANREDYVDRYVKWYLNESITMQFEAFKAGFNRVMGGTSICLLRPEELELLVCGTPHLNFHELEEVTRYEGGYSTKSAVIRWFWEMVHEMPLASQRKLLMFTTGNYKAPIGGLGKMHFLMQRAGPDCENLPTAHTCFNALLLPEYGTKEKLKFKLEVALNNACGFGLQ